MATASRVASLLPKMFGPQLCQAFRRVQIRMDPDWKMNPGKLIEPYKLDENLRLGAAYSPWQPETNFKFAADHGSLRRLLSAAWASASAAAKKAA